MTDVTAVTPNNFPGTLFCGEDGHLYVVTGSSNSRPILRIEPNALKEVSRFGSTSNGLTNSTLRFVATTWMGMVSAYGPSGRADFVLTGSLFDDVGLIRADTMGYVWGAGQSVTEPQDIIDGIGTYWRDCQWCLKPNSLRQIRRGSSRALSSTFCR